MAMKLLELYKSLLATAAMTTTSDGFVKAILVDPPKPMTVKGKSLVIPTNEQLSNPDWSNRVVFHPLFESITRGESDVLAEYRQSLNTRINVVVGAMGYDLLTLAASTAEHGKLNPDQAEFLSKVTNADEKTINLWKKLMPANAKDSTKSFVSIYLRRSGLLGGKKYARLSKVSFPLYQELKKGSKDVFGVKVDRVKDRETILALLEFIFPRIAEDDAYSAASNSTGAPSMEALMHSVKLLIADLNDLVELFKNTMDEDEVASMSFNDEWVEQFDNLDAMTPQVMSIPMLPGNEGASAKAPTPEPTATLTPPAPAQPVAPAMIQTVSGPAPATVTARPVIQTVTSAAPASSAPAPAPQFAAAPPVIAAPAPYYPPQPAPYYPPQPQYPGQAPMAYPQQYPGYPPQPAPQAPSAVTANGTLNLGAYLAGHPAVAATVYQNAGHFVPAPGQGSPYPVAPMQSTPRCMRPDTAPMNYPAYPQQQQYGASPYPAPGYPSATRI